MLTRSVRAQMLAGPFATVCAVSMFANVALAQDKDQFRNTAKSTAASLRALGEPKDRCSTGAFLADGGLVIRATPTTELHTGDRLVSINGASVANKATEEIVAILRATAPDATLPMVVQRGGSETKIIVACSNARTTIAPMIAALDLAAAGKFDDCVVALNGRTDLGTSGPATAAGCAALSRNAKANTGSYFYSAMRMQIEDATWLPSQRNDVLERLRAGEGMITQSMGAARYEELVSLTRTWPGGERAFERSQPDWYRFRTNAEAALRQRLIDPESARIEWPYGFTYGTWKPFLDKRLDGYWTCGMVNARNRMGGYVGSTSFAVVLDRSGIVKYADIGTGKDFDFLSIQCGNSVKLLPPPPAGMLRESTPANGIGQAVSAADELTKFAKLRAEGIITEEEFQAQKRKLLGI